VRTTRDTSDLRLRNRAALLIACALLGAASQLGCAAYRQPPFEATRAVFSTLLFGAPAKYSTRIAGGPSDRRIDVRAYRTGVTTPLSSGRRYEVEHSIAIDGKPERCDDRVTSYPNHEGRGPSGRPPEAALAAERDRIKEGVPELRELSSPEATRAEREGSERDSTRNCAGTSELSIGAGSRVCGLTKAAVREALRVRERAQYERRLLEKEQALLRWACRAWIETTRLPDESGWQFALISSEGELWAQAAIPEPPTWHQYSLLPQVPFLVVAESLVTLSQLIFVGIAGL